MSDEKVTHSRIEEGGFILPRVAYIDRIKDGLFWSLLFRLSRKIMNFSIRLQSKCMYQEEIHPYEDFIKAFKPTWKQDKNG